MCATSLINASEKCEPFCFSTHCAKELWKSAIRHDLLQWLVYYTEQQTRPVHCQHPIPQCATAATVYCSKRVKIKCAINFILDCNWWTLTTRVLTQRVPVGARGSRAAAKSHTLIFLFIQSTNHITQMKNWLNVTCLHATVIHAVVSCD